MMKLLVFCGIALGLQLSLIVPECKGEVRFRPDVHKLTDKQWEKFADAVKMIHGDKSILSARLQSEKDPKRRQYLMSLLKTGRPTLYDEMVHVHIQHYKEYHDNGYFFAWHRAFLLKFEQELQRVDPEVMLPYWDFTVYHDKLKLDPALSNSRFGGDGNRRGNFGIDGTFRDVLGFYRQNEAENGLHYISRADNFTTYHAAAPVVLRVNYLGLPTLPLFRIHLEATIHGRLHQAIGKEFFTHSSPNDPLFYSYHAFIDKIWFVWQNLHNFRYGHMEDHTLVPFDIKVKDVLDPRANGCSVYEESHYFHNGSVAGVPDVIINKFKGMRLTHTHANLTLQEQYFEILKRFNSSHTSSHLHPGELNQSERNKMYDQSIINQDHVRDLALESLAENDSSSSIILHISPIFALSILAIL